MKQFEKAIGINSRDRPVMAVDEIDEITPKSSKYD